MNRINPSKLLMSKWTAVEVKHKQRHFIVSKVHRDADETLTICELEAVIDKTVYLIDWRQLQDSGCWIMGWK